MRVDALFDAQLCRTAAIAKYHENNIMMIELFFAEIQNVIA